MFRKAVRSHVLKKKDDSLGSLLHETIKKQREEIRTAMMKFPYFNSWPDDKIHQCCVHSNIITYEDNEIIRVKDDANVDVTHFIIEGKVTVIQRLIIQVTENRHLKNETFKLYKDQSANINSKPYLKSVYMKICQMQDGATFGLGEELCKHVIISENLTKCLVIPKHIVLQHYSLDNTWKKIILFLNTVYPTLEEVFQHFLRGRKWKIYTENLYNSMTCCAPPTNITIHDLPLVLRATDLKYNKQNIRRTRSDLLHLIDKGKPTICNMKPSKQHK